MSRIRSARNEIEKNKTQHRCFFLRHGNHAAIVVRARKEVRRKPGFLFLTAEHFCLEAPIRRNVRSIRRHGNDCAAAVKNT